MNYSGGWISSRTQSQRSSRSREGRDGGPVSDRALASLCVMRWLQHSSPEDVWRHSGGRGQTHLDESTPDCLRQGSGGLTRASADWKAAALRWGNKGCLWVCAAALEHLCPSAWQQCMAGWWIGPALGRGGDAPMSKFIRLTPTRSRKRLNDEVTLPGRKTAFGCLQKP